MESLLFPQAQINVSAKQIRSGYKKCLDEVAKHFSSQDNKNEEVVHKLRVNLKRVNALIALLSFNNHTIPRKKLNAFKTLFRVAGKLRAIQVEFNVINKYFNSDSFNTNYLHQLHEKKAKTLTAYSDFLGSSRQLFSLPLLKVFCLKLQFEHWLGTDHC